MEIDSGSLGLIVVLAFFVYSMILRGLELILLLIRNVIFFSLLTVGASREKVGMRVA